MDDFSLPLVHLILNGYLSFFILTIKNVNILKKIIYQFSYCYINFDYLKIKLNIFNYKNIFTLFTKSTASIDHP